MKQPYFLKDVTLKCDLDRCRFSWYKRKGLITSNTHVKNETLLLRSIGQLSMLFFCRLTRRPAEREIDKRADRAKTICPRSIDMGA